MKIKVVTAAAPTPFVPDIEIEQIKATTVHISSKAMRFDSYVKPEAVARTVAELITEFNDLIEADELSPPTYKK